MTRFRTPRILILSTVLLAEAACSRSTPTEPDTFELRVVGVSSLDASFATADGQPAIREFHVLLDGREMDYGSAYRFNEPVAAVPFFADTLGVRRGRHTLTMRLTSSTISPVSCTATGVKVILLADGGTATLKTVASVVLPDQRGFLSAGEAFVVAFDL